MTFPGGLLVAPPPAQSLTPPCVVILKVFRWYISGRSFIYVWFVVLEFWNFKCFHTSRIVEFLGCFWVVFFGQNPLKCQICKKFWPVMQCIGMHQACDGFFFILKSIWNWPQKVGKTPPRLPYWLVILIFFVTRGGGGCVWGGGGQGFLGPFLPQIWLKFAEVLTRGWSLIIQRKDI